jgi:nicotinamide phosphoribosyltransferase
MIDLINCPIFYKDFYKVSHYEQYPKNTQLVFSNFTPRKAINGQSFSVFFGLQYFIKEYLEYRFKKYFFDVPKEEIMNAYRWFMKETLGSEKSFDHIGKLHDLGYLPIAIYAVDEGTLVSMRVPAMVIWNTHPDFYWLTNALETLLSCTLWGGCTSATIAYQYRFILDKYAKETSDMEGFVDYQAHDFSFRGMNSVEAAMISGAAHLNYFKGSDTIPAILFLNKYYGKDISCGTSIPATEHSVMSCGGKETEYETYKRLITEVYPNGFLSIVSDTWDLWHVVDTILPKLKSEIMNRDGKIVIRPDSGDPVKIICGDGDQKGLVERLWDIFGGTTNSKGYKQLDSHIGTIYGDSINLERCRQIMEGLKEKGFASTNVVLGIGSYTYQFNTRDTFGWAMKSTYAEIDGKPYNIYKDPKTDSGIKKSHKGLLKVIKDNGAHGQYLKVIEECSWDDFQQPDNELKIRFYDGVAVNLEEV